MDTEALEDSPRFEVLALDIDGVLIDPERGGLGHWTNELEQRHGITRKDWREAFFMQVWDDVVCGRRPIEPAVSEALVSLGSKVTVDELLDCWFDADSVIINSAVQLGAQAARAGYRTALVTNQEHRRAKYLRTLVGSSMHIDELVYSAEIGTQKHDPSFFVAATNRLQVHPQKILFVDDTPINVQRAAEAGWTALHADPTGTWRARTRTLLDLR